MLKEPETNSDQFTEEVYKFSVFLSHVILFLSPSHSLSLSPSLSLHLSLISLSPSLSLHLSLSPSLSLSISLSLHLSLSPSLSLHLSPFLSAYRQEIALS